MKKRFILLTIGLLSIVSCNKHTHTYSQAYVFDETNHWKQALCEHKDEVLDKGQHTFGEYSITKEPTTTSEGLKTKTCSVCGYQKSEKISKLVDNHTHTYSTEWSKDSSSHWHAATCEHINEKKDVASHEFSEWNVDVPATETTDGSKSKECSVCGYKVTEKINKIDAQHQHTYASTWSANATQHWHAATCEHINEKKDVNNHSFSDWHEDIPATETSEGKESRTCSVCSYKEERKIDKIQRVVNGTFTLYTFNDFHGAVKQYYSAHVGLEKFGTYLKQVSQQDNVLIIDSGDTYQGSIESNWNYGAMITDVFNYAHVDVHTLGNHDFDWGIDKIIDNKAKKATDGWSMTNLAANVYDYYFDYYLEGDVQQTQLGDKYYIKTLSNGIKVGVVGVIGRDQITSICTPLVKDVCFKEHIQILKDLSDELRTQQGCDFVIASIHESAEKSKNKGLTDVSPISNKKYFDYVACAHSHQDEFYEEYGVPFTQAIAYGECIYKADITITNNEVTNYDISRLEFEEINAQVSTIDPNITSIIAKYSPDYKSVGDETLAPFVNGKFYKNSTLPNLLCKAMFMEARNQGYYVNMAYCNEARYDIDNSPWTYSTIYEAFPFDNVIYIIRMRGQQNVKEVCNWNYRYHEASLTSMDTTTWYTVAVIDYLLFHTNDDRSYNYFNHGSLEILGTLKKNGKDYLYRDILADYLKTEYAATSKTLNYYDYLSSGNEFSKPSF